jgi:hypothetical protein
VGRCPFPTKVCPEHTPITLSSPERLIVVMNTVHVLQSGTFRLRGIYGLIATPSYGVGVECMNRNETDRVQFRREAPDFPCSRSPVDKRGIRFDGDPFDTRPLTES